MIARMRELGTPAEWIADIVGSFALVVFIIAAFVASALLN